MAVAEGGGVVGTACGGAGGRGAGGAGAGGRGAGAEGAGAGGIDHAPYASMPLCSGEERW